MARKKRKGRVHRQEAGAAPGTLRPSEDARPSRLHLIRYTDEDFQETHPASLEPEELDGADTVWLDVEGLGGGDLLKELGRHFSLHRLALEDLFYTQRPKSEFYDEHVVICLPMLADESGDIEQIRILVGSRYVFTFQEGLPGDTLEGVRSRLRQGRGVIRGRGAGYLAYALTDAVIDAYFPLLDQWGERLSELEEEVLGSPGQGTVVNIRQLRRRITNLRRDLRQLREGLGPLFNRGSVLLEREHPYFRDCYDHVLELLETLEGQREWATEILEHYQTALSQRTNEAMQTLTVIATVFIPLSFIAGVYGMNFDPSVSAWNMPELHWKWGYPFVLTLMAVVGGSLLSFFVRKGWLKNPD